MNSKEKGDQTEKEARQILEEICMVDRIKKNEDLFRFADIVAINEDGKFRLVQVKTNNTGTKWYYCHLASLLSSKHCDCELWIKNEKRECWDLQRYREDIDAFRVFHKTQSLNPEDIIEELSTL